MKTKKKIRCLIVEDEPLAQERLQLFIAKIPEKITCVATCNSPRQAWKILQKQEVDLLLMDICFSAADDENREGLDFVMFSKKDHRVPMVIFVSGHPKHAAEMWELDVCDFLLKPTSFVRFERAIDKAIKSLAINKKRTDESIIINYYTSSKGHISQRVLFKDIIYIKANDGFIEIFTLAQPKKPLCPYWKFSDTIKILPPHLLKQCHRSYACNRNFVQAWSNTKVNLLNDISLPISETQRKPFLHWLTYGE
ncbi:MAG: LytR/AlgR family response regulator transcription factor [Chitinophagales bacterium]